MGFCSCLPCFKDQTTRHSTEEEPEKPIPVQKIVSDKTTSTVKSSTYDRTSSPRGGRTTSTATDPTPSQAVTFSNEKEFHSPSGPAEAATYNVESASPISPLDQNNAVTVNDDYYPEPNPDLSRESNVYALKTNDPPTRQERPSELEANDTASHPAMADQLKSAASGVTDTVSSGAQQAQSAASSGAEKVQGATSSATTGTQDWEAMTEEQKKAAYDALPEDKKQNMSYYEWIKQGYYHQKENWMPWIEDQYLRWFTRDNKASYATKDAMDKTKVTGIDQVDKLQDNVNSTVSGQVGQGGLLQPVGDAVSKEGVNRAERGGKDDGGSYLGSAGNTLSSAGGSVLSGAKSAGGYVGGMFSGNKGGEAQAK